MSELSKVRADLALIPAQIEEARKRGDLRQVADLAHKYQQLQRRDNDLTRLAVAMTSVPQIVAQLHGFRGEVRARQESLAGWAEEERIHWPEKHPNEDIGKAWDNWEAARQKEEQETRANLNYLIATADSVRVELLQQISPQQQTDEDRKQQQAFAHAKADPSRLNLDGTADYLEKLVKRVPSPK